MKLTTAIHKEHGPILKLTRVPSGESMTYILRDEEITWLLARLTKIQREHFGKGGRP